MGMREWSQVFKAVFGTPVSCRREHKTAKCLGSSHNQSSQKTGPNPNGHTIEPAKNLAQLNAMPASLLLKLDKG
jgi:hypothetical protein